MVTVKLTPAQRGAAEVYLADPAHAHDFPEVSLDGTILLIDATASRAAEILIEAINSADVGDGRTPDRGAVKALTNVLEKLPPRR